MSDLEGRLRAALARARSAGEADPTSAKRAELERRVRRRRVATWTTATAVIVGLLGAGVWASGLATDRRTVPGPLPPAGPSPTPGGPTAGLLYSCGGPDPYRIADPHDHDEVPPEVWDVFASIQQGMDPGIGPKDPDEWDVVLLTESRVELLHEYKNPSAPGGGGFYRLSFERTGDGWEWASTGECDPAVIREEGLEPVTWRLAEKPASGAEVLQIDASEIQCTSGRKREPEAFVPEVKIDDDTVYILMSVESLPMGAADCIGNPSTRVDVPLGEPLGNRRIVDLSAYPPRTVYRAPS